MFHIVFLMNQKNNLRNGRFPLFIELTQKNSFIIERGIKGVSRF